jgi:hypothetical protein
MHIRRVTPYIICFLVTGEAKRSCGAVTRGGGCMGICIEEAGDEVKSLWSLYVGLHTRCNVKHNQI